jgi:type II secretory ATPase GspE/PulE/Tfp pilus assembly ATPase PilB-like protein
MTKLGFEKRQLQIFKEGIHQPYGMCLVTGPTGSGKTTSLYSALADLNKVSSNISTAEDPVEFNLEGINQVNVKKDIGLTFAASLKSFLRQDPDIIMVGEIRDYETGEIDSFMWAEMEHEKYEKYCAALEKEWEEAERLAKEEEENKEEEEYLEEED